ncbi:MAG: PRC-barrel domain-containing protein [Promethearchaeota archaeon]
MPRSFISKYQDKLVETIQGNKVARVVDVVFSPTTGKILAFALKVLDASHPLARCPPIEGSKPGHVLAPFSFFKFSNLRLLVNEREVESLLESEKRSELE